MTVNITKSFPIGWPGLVGEEIGIAAGTVGAIQVGINGRRGSIRIPDVPEEADGIIVRACVRHPQNGRYMVVEYGEPAASTKIELTEEMQEYYAKVTATGQIGISNSAQASPLQVADIRLVANYQYPCVQTNSLSYTSIGQRRHWVFRSLSTGEYVWRVGVRHTNDADMDFSAFYHVSLDEEDPLAPVGFVMSIQ